MRTDLSEIIFIIDESGSMGPLRDDTIGGFNNLIEDQKKEPGETRITTVMFNTSHRTVHNNVHINEIELLNRNMYCPCGGTALLDALGDTINSVGVRLANTPEEERPASVLIVITTDGEENASHVFTKNKIKEMIEHQQNVYNWKFMYLGANIDAISEAESYGIFRGMAATYSATSKGVDSVYAAASAIASRTKACAMENTLCDTEAYINTVTATLDSTIC